MIEPHDSPEAKGDIADQRRAAASADAGVHHVPATPRPLFEQMGGVRGMIDGGLPPLAYVTVNTLAGLRPALIVAIATLAVLSLVRLVRRESLKQIVGGFVGLGIAALIAARTGRAEGFFLPDIIKSAAFAALLLVSATVGRPLIGYILAIFEGTTTWREDRVLRRACTVATVAWGIYMTARAGVGYLLHEAGSPVGLVVLKLSGLPLLLIGAALTVAYTGRSRTAP